MTWVPTTCTLPAPEQPLRAAEFDALFTDALRSVNPLAPTRLQFTLDSAPEVEERARDLAARETACCSFFTFDFTRDSRDQLLMDISVPDTQTAVLEALADRAEAAQQNQP
ncbi:hypothetical protein OG607_10875 [Streptomyces sp. NBC_01537]|uniref:hypothetical protein n=1 Tax=Streptomyces sp. NBC_01537 TaxID=2903896 RepID=UPI00386C14C0